MSRENIWGTCIFIISIIVEVIGTSAFKEFTQVCSRIMAIIGYGASFYFLSLVFIYSQKLTEKNYIITCSVSDKY
ncbi:SMR family transporter [uncultured Desulfobacter sp.]|uniref:SMR family transporter n=1 Tax=uncultured Desulfobacter sp. TaxID=240139 RepID=UPI003747A26A